MAFWTKKNITEAVAGLEKNPEQLRRVLGPFDLILLGIGVIIGAGLFSITGIAAAQHAGPAILLSFLIAAVGCAFAGLSYCELACMVPISGSAYTYAYVTMGEFFAWIIGWDLILEYAMGASAVAISWSAYLTAFLQDFGIMLPWQWTASPFTTQSLPGGTTVQGLVNLPAMGIIIFLSGLLIIGTHTSLLLNRLVVAIKLGVILIFIGVGLQYINMENYVPFIPANKGSFGEFGWSGILRASGMLFFAYIGFDSISTTAQEAKNPKKDLPIGILGSLVICTALYMAFSAVMLGIVPYTELNVDAPVAVAIDHTPYPWLKSLIKLAILAGFTSVVLVLLLGQSRIFYAMACDGLLPQSFAALHPRFQTPWKCNCILMFFASIFSGFLPFKLLGTMTSIGTLLAFVIVCTAVPILRYRHPEIPRTFKISGGATIPLLGVATCLLMMASLDFETWMRLIAWFLLGLAIYAARYPARPYK